MRQKVKTENRNKLITASLYPDQIKKIGRIMRAYKIRKVSQAIQRIVDEMPEPADDCGQAAGARP